MSTSTCINNWSGQESHNQPKQVFWFLINNGYMSARDKNDIIHLLKTIFFLATYESSCILMDYFSSPVWMRQRSLEVTSLHGMIFPVGWRKTLSARHLLWDRWYWPFSVFLFFFKAAYWYEWKVARRQRVLTTVYRRKFICFKSASL